MLETESGELAERLVRGQVSRADQEETTFHLKRELDASRQRDAENTAQLRELQQRLKHMEEVTQRTIFYYLFTFYSFPAVTKTRVTRFHHRLFCLFGVRSIELIETVVSGDGTHYFSLPSGRAAQTKRGVDPMPSGAAYWRPTNAGRDGGLYPGHEEPAA